MEYHSHKIAVLLPCYNEAITITKVIEAFKKSLPEADIYVFDNNSADKSAELALKAGATVARVQLQGKGNVVRRMFADVDADVYIMADADETYDASRACELIDPILKGEADTVIATRQAEDGAFRAGHALGNHIFNKLVQCLFGQGLEDIFSGYRSFSRRFVKSFPAHSRHFDIETELSIFILEQRIPFIEIPMIYGKRPEGSNSKLSTYRDGARILLTIFRVFKDSRPLLFFTSAAVLLALMSIFFALPIIKTWLDTGLVPRQPTVILCMGLALLSSVSFVAGMMLDSTARVYREIRHLHYLQLPHTLLSIRTGLNKPKL